MSQTTIEAKFYVAGVLSDVTSATLSDAAGAYGVRRSDTGAVVVADATAMTHAATGVYQYSFEDPSYDLIYEYAIEFLRNGIVTRVSEFVAGTPSPSAGSGSILALVQAAPDIGTDNGDYVASLISKAERYITARCGLDSFPLLSRGVSESGMEASEDLSALSSETLLVSIDGSPWRSISIDASACTTGVATAAHLQAAIRAASASGSAISDFAFEAAEATWDAAETRYRVKSPTYGERSVVLFNAEGDGIALLHALKLTSSFGGSERRGTESCEALEAICAQFVIDAYRAVRLAPEAYGDEARNVALTAEAFALAWRQNEDAALRFRRLR
jgi:hypothetical protein